VNAIWLKQQRDTLSALIADTQRIADDDSYPEARLAAIRQQLKRMREVIGNG
jgi:hypothetical protein